IYQQNGLPYRILTFPDFPTAESGQPGQGYRPPDDDVHYLTALRLYALLAHSDVNLIYYFSNRYRLHAFPDKSRFRLSFSRYFFTDWELHLESLLQLGTARRFADPGVANGGMPSAPTIDAILPQRELESDTPNTHLIVGTRRMFSDESNLSLEYYFQSDGYNASEFQDYVRLLARAGAMGLGGLIGQTNLGSGSGLPSKFTFDPLRRHYLIAGYSKPKIHDDWTLGATLIWGLEDLSGLLSPTVSWNAKEWLTLSFTGFIPIPGFGTACAVAKNPDGSCPSGRSYSEYSLIPQDVRVLFEARAFY